MCDSFSPSDVKKFKLELCEETASGVGYSIAHGMTGGCNAN